LLLDWVRERESCCLTIFVNDELLGNGRGRQVKDQQRMCHRARQHRRGQPGPVNRQRDQFGCVRVAGTEIGHFPSIRSQQRKPQIRGQR
jgi:hypothetical protein